MTFRIVSQLNPVVISGDVTMSGGVAASITGNTAGTAALLSSGTMYLAGGSNITLSQSQNTISIVGGAGGAGGGIAASAGTQSVSTGTVKFADSNGITFGMSGSSQITASHNGLTTQTVQTQNMVSVLGSTGDISFANGNGVSFGGNASTITASHNGLTSQSNQALSGSNGSFAFQTATFGNLNGLSFYTSNGSMVGSYTVPTVPSQTEYVFSNSNGVSFGTNGSTVTASHNGLTSQSNQALSAGNGSFAFQTASFSNANGISFSTSAGSAIVASHNGITSQTVQTQSNIAGLYDGANSISTGTARLSNSNGVSFGINGQTITASHNGITSQTNQTLGLYASSNTTGQSSSSTFDARTLSFRGMGVASVGMSGGEVLISVPSGGGAGDGVNILAAGTQTANTTGTVLFDNGNGVTFGMANSSVITASHNGLTQQSTQPVALSGSNGSFNFSTATFGNLNGMSFYTSNGSMVGSYTVPNVPAQTNQTVGGYFVGNTTGQSSSSTVDARSISIDGAGIVSAGWSNGSIRVSATQSNQAWSGSNASSTFQTLSFNNANGVSWSNNGGAVQASYTVPTVTNSSLTMQAGASTLSSVSRIHFGDSNGVSFGASTSNNGSITITATVATNYLTSQSNQNVTAANGGFAFQTLSFSNVNGVSFGTSAGSAITASHNGITSQTNQTIGIYGSSQTTGQSSSSTYDARSLTFRGAGIVSVGNSGGEVIISATGGGGGVTPVASASNGSFSFTTLGFSNANNVTFGTSAGSIITASVAAPGAAAENNNINLLGANTAGNTTASGSTIGWSGINLTLSGTNGSAVNISAPATSSLSATGQLSISTNGSTISMGVPSAVTYSRYNEFKESPMVAGAIGQASLHIQPWLIPNLHADRVVLHNQFSNASNSSNSFTLSQWVGIYTENGSTLSLASSTSVSTNFTASGTVGSYSQWGGIRALTIGWTNTFTEGMYWIGVIHRTTTGGGAGQTVSQLLNSNINSSYSGILGVASNATNQWSRGMGVYTASTTAMPGSVAFSQINGNSSVFLRPPSLYFVSGTV